MSGIHDVARAAGIKDTEAHALFQAILDSVNRDERVYVKGFGTFTRKVRAARTITSPQLADGVVHVPETVVIAFKASPTTKEMLNAKPETKAKPAAKTAAKPAPAANAKPAAKPAIKKPKPAPAAAEAAE